MGARGLDSGFYSTVYYINVKGGLTAADLVNDLAKDSSAYIPKSELFKNEFLAKVQDSSCEMDRDVRKALTRAIEELKPKLDVEFYELGEAEAVLKNEEQA
jgi:hypothetical protein